VHIDLTDPAKRAKLAELVNGLHRWPGREYECVARASLKLTLVDGRTCSVTHWTNGQLQLVVVRPGHEQYNEQQRVFVKSGEMERFLESFVDVNKWNP
jgi:hypothetical protein